MSEQKQVETPYWLVSDYPALKNSDIIGEAAINSQVFTFPQVV